MPREEAPPSGWSRIARTTENPASSMLTYGRIGLERFDFEGREWPPRLPHLPDAILYADVKEVELRPPPDPSIPPQPVSQGPFTLSPPSLSFPEIQFPGVKTADEFIGPVRLRVQIYRLNGGTREIVSDTIVSLLSTVLSDPKSLLTKVGEKELEIMKQLAGTGSYDLEVVLSLECAQPFWGKSVWGTLKALVGAADEADWFWVKTVQRTFPLPYPVLAPKVTPIKEIDVLRDEAGKIKDALYDAAGNLISSITDMSGYYLGQIERKRDDFIVEAGKQLSTLTQFKVELPALSQFYVDQGIKNAITGFVTRTDLDGIIQGVQIGLLSDVEKEWGKKFEDISKEGAAQKELLDGQVYAMRQDFKASEGRIQKELETLFSMIKPLKTAIGERLTRKEVEDIVGQAIEKLKADLTPPVAAATINAYALQREVAKVGDSLNVQLSISALQPGQFRVPGFVDAAHLSIGSRFYRVTLTAPQAGTNYKDFTLEAAAPDGTWHAIGVANVQYNVGGLKEPTTDEPPSYDMMWNYPPGFPSPSLAAGLSQFGVIQPVVGLYHQTQTTPGAGWGFGFRLQASFMDGYINQTYYNVKAMTPTEWGGYQTLPMLQANTLSFPQRKQELKLSITTFIHDSNLRWYKKTEFPQLIFPIKIAYPEPKFADALKPPSESMPGQQFPMMITWENQTKTAGLIRIGGHEVLAPPGPSILPLFSTFPEQEVDSASMEIPLEVKGPGGVWEKVDSMSFDVFRAPVQAKLTKLSVPGAANPGDALSVLAECNVIGIPKGSEVPVRLVLGDMVFAEGAIQESGALTLTPKKLSMSDFSLGGNAELQVWDKSRGESKRWMVADIRYLRVDILKPLPFATLSLPLSVPAGEPVPVSMSVSNLGDAGRVKGSFLQTEIFDKQMAPQGVTSYNLTLTEGLWDDSDLSGNVQVPVGGKEERSFSALMRVVFPQSSLRNVEAPEYVRAGKDFTLAVELWNSGELGTIGVLIGDTDQSSKVGASTGITMRSKHTMPAVPVVVIPVQSYHIGRFRERVLGSEDTRVVRVAETAFVTGKSFTFYGAPGLSVSGVVVGTNLVAKGWDMFPDGQAPPVSPFKKSFSGYEVAEFTGDIQLLYIKAESGSFAVVEEGRLVESAASEYSSTGASRGASTLLNFEKSLALPPMLRQVTQAVGKNMAYRYLK